MIEDLGTSPSRAALINVVVSCWHPFTSMVKEGKLLWEVLPHVIELSKEVYHETHEHKQ